MINRIEIENFKAFSFQRLDLGSLTLLAGLNGMGKSTVLQALLLLRQSYDQGFLPDRGLALNGALVQLGIGTDVLFTDAQEETISFRLTTNQGEGFWRFGYDRINDVLNVENGSTKVPDFGSSLFSPHFHYLSAERIGPRTSFEMSEYLVKEQRHLGTHGEFTTHFLHTFRDEPILEELILDNQQNNTLMSQTMAWMNEISPGTRIEVQTLPRIDRVQVDVSFDRGGLSPNKFRPTNVGFGIMYVLPVVVAVLSSKAGSLVLIENPEAHLHPRGQTHIARLIARAAQAGVQILLETHSDHILNGIRVAIRKSELEANKAQLHFFYMKDSPLEAGATTPSVSVLSPTVDADGRIDVWPEDFFDEWDKSLEELL